MVCDYHCGAYSSVVQAIYLKVRVCPFPWQSQRQECHLRLYKRLEDRDKSSKALPDADGWATRPLTARGSSTVAIC